MINLGASIQIKRMKTFSNMAIGQTIYFYVLVHSKHFYSYFLWFLVNRVSCKGLRTAFV